MGSQARILYSDQKGRVAIAVAINQAIASGKIKVRYPVLLQGGFINILAHRPFPMGTSCSHPSLPSPPLQPSESGSHQHPDLAAGRFHPPLAEFLCRDTRFPEGLGLCGADKQRGLGKSCSGSQALLERQWGGKENMEGLTSSQSPDPDHRSLWWGN